MQCLSCQTDNPPANRFCDHCGAPLDARCPQCKAVLRAGARFCGTCGHSVAPAHAAAAAIVTGKPARSIASYTPKHLAEKVLKARSAIEGERRQVTVLTCSPGLRGRPDAPTKPSRRCGWRSTLSTRSRHARPTSRFERPSSRGSVSWRRERIWID